jgi:hypothetical protein
MLYTVFNSKKVSYDVGVSLGNQEFTKRKFYKQLFHLGNARRSHCSYLVEARAPAAQYQQKSRVATKLPIQNFTKFFRFEK